MVGHDTKEIQRGNEGACGPIRRRAYISMTKLGSGENEFAVFRAYTSRACKDCNPRLTSNARKKSSDFFMDGEVWRGVTAGCFYLISSRYLLMASLM